MVTTKTDSLAMDILKITYNLAYFSITNGEGIKFCRKHWVFNAILWKLGSNISKYFLNIIAW